MRTRIIFVFKNCWIRQFSKLLNSFEFSNFGFSNFGFSNFNSNFEFSNFNSAILIQQGTIITVQVHDVACTVPYRSRRLLFLWVYERTKFCLHNKHPSSNGWKRYTNCWPKLKTLVFDKTLVVLQYLDFTKLL